MRGLDFNNYSITSIDSITGFDIATGECVFILDEIQDATIEGDAEVVWQTGREGRRLSALKRNKTCSITANNGFIVGGLLREQIGDTDPTIDMENATIEMPAFERLTVAGGAVETTFEAVGTAGAEIMWVYRQNRDSSQGEKFAQGASASADTFAYDPATRTITLPTGEFEDGDMVIVFYNHLTRGVRYTNRSDQYAGDVRLVCDILVSDVCDGSMTHSKLVMSRASLSDNFSFTFGSDPAVQSFTAEAIATVCGGEREFFYWVIPQLGDDPVVPVP